MEREGLAAPRSIPTRTGRRDDCLRRPCNDDDIRHGIDHDCARPLFSIPVSQQHLSSPKEKDDILQRYFFSEYISRQGTGVSRLGFQGGSFLSKIFQPGRRWNSSPAGGGRDGQGTGEMDGRMWDTILGILFGKHIPGQEDRTGAMARGEWALGLGFARPIWYSRSQHTCGGVHDTSPVSSRALICRHGGPVARFGGRQI